MAGGFMIRLSRAVPEPVKRIGRLLRLAFAAPPPPAKVPPAEVLVNCRLLAQRLDLIDQFPKGAVIAELGVERGRFSRAILAQARPAELHLVDLDFSLLARDVAKSPLIRRHQGPTVEIAGQFPDGHFDVVYVDADHTFEGVTADIRAWAPKVKPGGLMAFNDFARILRPTLGTFGVHQAVMDFIDEARWEVAFFCFHPEALYDIALRKPEP